LLDAGRETLADFAQEWWRLYAEPNLAAKTQAVYAGLWDRHVLRRLGGYELRRLTPQVIEGFQAELRAAGVGEPTILKTLALLQGMLRRAVVWQRIAANPVAAIKKPSQRRTRTVQALPPEKVEALRASLLAHGAKRDATLVSLLAYAGLRPGEALALTWGDIGERTILVKHSLSLGEIKETKTGQVRTVKLLAPLAADLAEWRLARGRPAPGELVFPTRRGATWSDEDWRNWRRRVFQPAARAIGLEGLRPYDLRHSFVSLLLAERRSLLEVARQAGHSPTMALNTYGHVIEELEDADKVSAEAAIRRARAKLVRTTFARQHGGRERRGKKSLGNAEAL
jgi:integrase